MVDFYGKLVGKCKISSHGYCKMSPFPFNANWNLYLYFGWEPVASILNFQPLFPGEMPSLDHQEDESYSPEVFHSEFTQLQRAPNRQYISGI